MEIPKYDAIFMIGPQGSGKGTQGKVLAVKLGYFYWEMGAILREEAKKSTPFGIKVKSLIDEGKLLEDEELFRVLQTELPEVIKHKRLLFDGVPRTVPQAVHLIHYLQQNGYTQFGAVHIDVPHEESVTRLLERAHHEFREDDTPEKINLRLATYDEQTKPVLKFMEGIGDLHTVDGVGTIAEITERIDKIFQE
ncbi:MAG TPA: nucleoside monophosphate kinase [Patescibacteria group bacterium]|jgi:adenylate kinase|nr:nucleoside monophosphate kinase [Patescibacteria group bacterium]